jgi:hypothetical protein
MADSAQVPGGGSLRGGHEQDTAELGAMRVEGRQPGLAETDDRGRRGRRGSLPRASPRARRVTEGTGGLGHRLARTHSILSVPSTARGASRESRARAGGTLHPLLHPLGGITLFPQRAPGPRPVQLRRPAFRRSLSTRRIMSRLTPGHARSRSAREKAPGKASIACSTSARFAPRGSRPSSIPAFRSTGASPPRSAAPD